MFKQLFDVLSEGDTVKIIVTKNKETLSTTVLAVVKEDVKAALAPLTAKGTPEDLDEQLIPAFGKTLEESRELVIEAGEMKKSAEALKKAEETKKKEDAKKKSTGGSNKSDVSNPAISNSTKKTDDSDGESGNDDVSEDDENDDDDKPIENKVEIKKEKVEKVVEPKYTTAQKKALENVAALMTRAERESDVDMVEFLRKQVIRTLNEQELPTEKYVESFETIISKFEIQEA
jgi:PRTRC genetic system protein E